MPNRSNSGSVGLVFDHLDQQPSEPLPFNSTSLRGTAGFGRLTYYVLERGVFWSQSAARLVQRLRWNSLFPKQRVAGSSPVTRSNFSGHQ